MKGVKTTEMFDKKLLRKFSPRYYYNPFSKLDITELENLIEYAKGLVVKDEDLADKYENDNTLKNADKYIRAIEGINGKVLPDAERQTILSAYTEQNPYYAELYKIFGIQPYFARRAKNYHIIKANNKTLTARDEATFQKCYYEALDYMMKVIHTEAFDNQEHAKDFFNMYLIFSTILKVINHRMEDYFDVDTYNAETLKNGFISWGFDYFDELPVSYQRRVYKIINDLVRTKGTNKAFETIKNIFTSGGVSINRYVMVKKETSSKQSIDFYRVPIGESLDINKHESFRFDELTDPDPYWRSSEEEILQENFNVVESKYLSVDSIIDMMKNSRDLSFMVALLNEAEVIDHNRIKEATKNLIISRKEAREQFGFTDSTFYMRNRQISPNPIYLYDAIIALQVLIFGRMKWDEYIHRVNFIIGIYAFNINNQELIYNKVKEIREMLYWERDKYPPVAWQELMNFLAGFRLKSLQENHIPDLEQILYKYKSSGIFKRQMWYMNDYIKDIKKTKRFENYLKANAHYEALEYLANVITESPVATNPFNIVDNETGEKLDIDIESMTRKVPLKVLIPYPHITSVLAEFIQYQIACGYMSRLRLANILKEPDVFEEVKTFLFRAGKGVSDDDLTYRYDSLEIVDMVVDEIQKEENRKRLNYLLSGLENLRVFLTICIVKKQDVPREILTIEEFKEVFEFNSRIKDQLEDYIKVVSDPDLYMTLKELWDLSFINSFNMEPFKGSHRKWSEWLAKRDPELYKFTRIERLPYDFTSSDKNIYRDKVFSLVELIDGFISSGRHNNLFMENSFIGVASYIKRYLMILVNIFKAYTMELVDRNMTYKLADEFYNSIRVMDKINIEGTNLLFTDDLEVVDSMGSRNYLTIEEVKPALVSYYDDRFVYAGISTGTESELEMDNDNRYYKVISKGRHDKHNIVYFNGFEGNKRYIVSFNYMYESPSKSLKLTVSGHHKYITGVGMYINDQKMDITKTWNNFTPNFKSGQKVRISLIIDTANELEEFKKYKTSTSNFHLSLQYMLTDTESHENTVEMSDVTIHEIPKGVDLNDPNFYEWYTMNPRADEALTLSDEIKFTITNN